MRIPSAILTLIAGMALVLLGQWVANDVNWLPVSASTNAPVYDELFRVLLAIGTMLLVGMTGVVVYSLIRFRRRDGDQQDGPPVEGNLSLELFWTAIPAVVVLFLGIYSYDIYDRMGGMTDLNAHGMDHHVAELASVRQSQPGDEERIWGGIAPASGNEAVLPVEVTALQFAFVFHYPEQNITSGELHVPTGQAVELRLKANDVIHAFWVPEFRIKQDVIPGQPTVLTFTANRIGDYPIVCAELCGPYHGGMRSHVVVDEPESFATWVETNTPATLS
ncbi:MAG TPA: cytochrome c oxidase subunit II [Synechococcales bacterium UBA12195]|jgi:cytochrome c oxidase subunit 2|nr:cytochrome c oxidase subunit II [Cyanobacteriota bacterium]HCV56455.1 cytochrome c oxidase subunit II [Synechococcales bacterium UBA12195]|tara:strand:+ start:2633 stop:3463 length:831 start_codon:yes stop_codon:yes gene_type:complete